jgi:hypothetical protein
MIPFLIHQMFRHGYDGYIKYAYPAVCQLNEEAFFLS